MPDLCLRDLKQGRRPADLTRSSHSIPFPVSAKLLQTLHALAKRENEETPVLFRQLGFMGSVKIGRRAASRWT